MFIKEKNPSAASFNPASATLISAGTTLVGNVQSETDLRIDGTVQGNIVCTSKVIVGPNGCVEGDIEGAQADITGRVIGNMAVKDLLQLREKCQVQGNIAAGKLQIDPTALFNGQCQMGTEAEIVQMGPSNEQQAKAN